ncbi:MAG: response regulator [Anaerolineae bacterium]|nr:response regulator [Anaerolineae bacterium]
MPKRALIIDDDNSNQTLWRNFLVEHSYEVVIAPDLETAQQYVSEDIDLFLVDYYLPDGYGTAMVAAARQGHPSAIVIMVSMDDDADIIRESMQAGGNLYVVKPSTPTLMTQILTEIESGLLHSGTRQLINRHGRRSYGTAAF